MIDVTISPTRVVFDHITELDPELVRRSAAFAAGVALLNRNRNFLGEVHQPVTLVTDRLDLITETRASCTFFENQATFLGTCWSGSYSQGGSLIWLNHRHDNDVIRGRAGLVNTLVHELAHAYTRGKHGWTFRRMFALLQPRLYELFDVYYKTEHLRDLIARYQSNHITERSGGDAYAYTFVDKWDRRDEEFAAHMAASARLERRLHRLQLNP